MYLTQGFHRSLQQTPDRAMTVFGERIRTYREAGDRIARFAGALRSIGVRGDDRVAVLAQNCDNYCELLLAIPWADAILNPVNTRWGPSEIAYSLADSSTRVLVVDAAFAPLAPRLAAAYPGLEAVVYCGDGPTPAGMLGYEALIADNAPVGDVRRANDATAGIFYTGGTTGFPKGVTLTHANIVTSVLGAAACGVGSAGGTYLHVAPMFHLADFTGGAVQSFVGGTHVALAGFAVEPFLDVVERHRVTSTTLVPAMIQAIVDHPATAGRDLSSIDSVLYGGSPIGESLLTRAVATFSSARFTQAYGMTELAGLATMLLPDDHHGHLMRSAGRAIPHTEVRVVDPERREVPRTAVGEIAVRGGNVMPGYWNRPDETAATLLDGWLHTGDLGYMDEDGYVYVVDRIKDMIVTGGENVYSAEVENVLSTHPAVRECAVIGLPDDRWGERVHAVVVLRAHGAADAADLRDHVRASIAGYKVPRSVEFLDTLPRTPAGKVLKRDLRNRHRS